MDSSPTRTRSRAIVATAGAAAIIGSCLLAGPAQAANSDIGYPVFGGSANPVPATGVAYTPGNQMDAIFDADVAAGAGSSTVKDFWFDKMLARTGTAGSFDDNNQWLFTRGRAAFMKTHTPGTLGFAGGLAYWESIDGRDAYTVTVKVGGSTVTLAEDTAQRKQTPSYWHSVHTGGGIEVRQTKFITNANVLVTELEVRSTGAARNVTLRAVSPFATSAEGDELTGTVKAINDITLIHPRLSGDGFAPVSGGLETTLAVPAGGSVTTKVQLGLVTDEIADSRSEYDTVAAATPEAAYTQHVTAYNRWWADNVPYLDTPEDNIDKTLFYRWWLLRFNYLDANAPGNTYQFPTAVEGALGYNNAIDLTVGMFIDDLKYFRDPIYSYGGWVSTGETSKGSRFVDNPGDPANWSASHTQYISEAAWRSYQIHGGQLGIVENLARYAEGDAKGQLSAYDSNNNGVLETNWNAWTGNDADALSFDYYGRTNERAESAYVYSGAKASAEAYRLLGRADKATELDAVATKVKNGIVDNLWDSNANLIKHRDLQTGNLIPWKEINNYYPFAVGLMPKPGDDDYDDDYADALRLFADDKEYPVFPFATANQADRQAAAAAGHPGTNNFSIINSTVTFRMLGAALRDYPTDAIDAEWYKKLLYWNAWAHYQNGGDNRLPDANEFWADGTADPQKIGYRSWIHHTILGTTNFTMIEDAMGLRPRTDAKIELYPIDIDWPHFTANNIRYRDSDLTITWDEPGDGKRPYGDDVPEGYSVFIDGVRAFTVDELTHLVYDPATGVVEFEEDQVNHGADPTVTFAAPAGVAAPQDVVFADDQRVVDLFAKAGQDISSHRAPNLALNKTATASFSAGSRPASAAVNGTTVNEPFWGTAGSPNASDTLEVDLGSPQQIDTVRAYFYDTSSTGTIAGYSEPASYRVEYYDGGQWKTVPSQVKSPAVPQPNRNEVRFPEVTAQRVRIDVTHAPGLRTGVKELQVFRTGLPVSAPVNAAPSVTAFLAGGAVSPGRAELTGIVKDDALPGGGVSSSWSVVSAPAGSAVLFDNPTSPSTTVRFSASGEYRLRLTATDGALSAAGDIVFTGSAADGGTDIGPAATPTASYTAGWNNVRAVNDGVAIFSGGEQTQLWGTWSASRPASQWLQYTWPSAVRVNGASISFWTDAAAGTGDNVSVPRSWKIQYRDGTGQWVDVSHPSAYGTARTSANATTFDTVTTTALRATFNASSNAAGTSYSAVGVSEWDVFSVAPVSADPVHVRTTPGVLPTLPANVGTTYADDTRALAKVTWEPVTASQVASETSFDVHGIVDNTSLIVTATVWVRSASAVTINQIDPVAVKTAVNVAPALPPTAVVLYNDGSRESLPVTWATIAPSKYAANGQFTVAGAVQSQSPGAKEATATVTVGTGSAADTQAPTVQVSTSPGEAESGWFTGPVAVTVTATDAVDPDPKMEVRVDGLAWTPYSGPVTVSSGGSHSLEARATDAAGNVSAVASITLKIDAAPPVVTADADEIARTVRLSAADPLSGVASLEYRIGEGEWTPYTKAILAGLDETVVQYRSADVAGNASEAASVTLPAAGGDYRRNVALIATPSASYTASWNRVGGLNDDVQPTTSGTTDPLDNENVWGAWPEVGDQSVQYDWTSPVTVGEIGVYFADDLDADGNGIGVPKAWSAQYWDGAAASGAGAWVAVADASEYTTKKDAYNTVTFAPVTTTGLRLLLTPQGTTSGAGSLGVKEWQAFEVGAAGPVAPHIEVSVTDRCVAAKATLVATAVNHGDVPATVTLSTPYRAKTFVVAPGKTVSSAFATRAKSHPEGAVHVSVTADVDGTTVSSEEDVSFSAFGC